MSSASYSLGENLEVSGQVTFPLKCLGLTTDRENSGNAGTGTGLSFVRDGRDSSSGVLEIGHGDTGGEFSSLLVIVGEWC